ncbi:MAG: hypothetical protein LBR36_01685 [Bacteroidales bacterium]|jgi:hypothetical protein|nr:hypothetical protein [Bacteroidales bacterium]
MKKPFVIGLICIITAGGLWAQDTLKSVPTPKKQATPAKHLLFKDRVFVDIFSSYWLGVDKDITQKVVNMGCNAAIMFDIPVKKGKPFSFGLGVGVTNQNLHSDALWKIDNADGGKTIAQECPVADSAFKSNLSFTYVHIPLEFRFFHKSGFKMSVGVRVGLMADIHSKYFGPYIHEDGTVSTDEKQQIKDYNIPNRTKIPIEVTFRTGWKFVSLNASYMITPMFKKGDGPQVHPISFGITINIY